MRTRETCETCGKVREPCEMRCTQCAVASAIPDDWYILITGPSLRFRLIEGVKMAAAFALTGLLVVIAGLRLIAFLQRTFTGTIASIIWFIMAIAALFAAVICFSAVYVFLSGIRSNEIISVTKKKIQFNNQIDLYETLEDDVPEETKFIEGEMKLADVLRIQVKQGWLAQRLGYGDIEIFADQGSKPTGVISGITKPEVFREKLELIWKARDTPVSELKPIPIPPPQKNEERGERGIIHSKQSEPDVKNLKVSLWVATPVALGVGHIAVFLVGLVIGIVENPIAGVLVTVALSSWPLGMFAAWGIYYYFPRSNWPLKVLVAIGVCLLNGVFFALTIWCLIGRIEYAAGFSIVGMMIVFVGSLFFIPDSPQPFFFELFEKFKDR